MADLKAIIIDPIKREVRSARFEPSLDNLYQLMECEQVQVVYPEAIGGETLWVDEEGKQKPNHHFMLRTFEHDILSGVCIITSDRGDTTWSPEEIEEFVEWRPDLDGEQLLV